MLGTEGRAHVPFFYIGGETVQIVSDHVFPLIVLKQQLQVCVAHNRGCEAILTQSGHASK